MSPKPYNAKQATPIVRWWLHLADYAIGRWLQTDAPSDLSTYLRIAAARLDEAAYIVRNLDTSGERLRKEVASAREKAVQRVNDARRAAGLPSLFGGAA